MPDNARIQPDATEADHPVAQLGVDEATAVDDPQALTLVDVADTDEELALPVEFAPPTAASPAALEVDCSRIAVVSVLIPRHFECVGDSLNVSSVRDHFRV